MKKKNKNPENPIFSLLQTVYTENYSTKQNVRQKSEVYPKTITIVEKFPKSNVPKLRRAREIIY